MRSIVLMIYQEPVLFQGTVFQNITYGFSDSQKLLSKEEQMVLVQEACETSNAHDFVTQLPEVWAINFFCYSYANCDPRDMRQRLAKQQAFYLVVSVSE